MKVFLFGVALFYGSLGALLLFFPDLAATGTTLILSNVNRELLEFYGTTFFVSALLLFATVVKPSYHGLRTVAIQLMLYTTGNWLFATIVSMFVSHGLVTAPLTWGFILYVMLNEVRLKNTKSSQEEQLRTIFESGADDAHH